MKIFEVKERLKGSGELILGAEETGSHACYLIYGLMKSRENGRELKPGKGHEELFLAVKGVFSITGAFEGVINEGEAFHLRGEETCFAENLTDSEAVYIMAGGHSGEGHH